MAVVLALSAGTAALYPSATIYAAQSPIVSDQEVRSYHPATQRLVQMLEKDTQLKALLEKSIAQAAKINPDPQTNPAQNLKAYIEYVNWAEKAMPWAILPGVEKNHPSIYNRIDQSLNYFYFVNDQPLSELQNQGLYIPSVQYMEPYRSWLIDFVKSYGQFLSTEQSWNDEYLAVAKTDDRFGLQTGEYESPSNWKSFNDFFVRRLADPDKRPTASGGDDSVVVFPGDSVAQGVWSIGKDNTLHSLIKGPVGQPEFVQVKSKLFTSVGELMGPSRYREAFAGGTMTHTFLDVYDYHRFHFPVTGTIKEVLKIEGDTAVGGFITWEPSSKSYVLNASIPGCQMIETRALIVLDTEKYGLVAVLPIGMSQISSVELEKSVKVGARVKKGDPLGCFLFGGSDIVMLFQKGVDFELTVPQKDGRYEHRLMGQEYGRLSIQR